MPVERQHISLSKLIEDKLEGVCVSACFNPKKLTIHFNIPAIKNINEWTFEIEDILFTTVSLIELLEKEGFLLIYQTNSLFQIDDGKFIKTESTTFGKGTESGVKREIKDERYIDLLLRYCIKDIIPTDEFKRFCRRGFIARDEQRFRRQSILAISALVVAVISSTANLKNLFSNGTKIKQEQIDSIRTDLKVIHSSLDSINENSKFTTRKVLKELKKNELRPND